MSSFFLFLGGIPSQKRTGKKKIICIYNKNEIDDDRNKEMKKKRKNGYTLIFI
jgi:hypothetical protein